MVPKRLSRRVATERITWRRRARQARWFGVFHRCWPIAFDTSWHREYLTKALQRHRYHKYSGGSKIAGRSKYVRSRHEEVGAYYRPEAKKFDI